MIQTHKELSQVRIVSTSWNYEKTCAIHLSKTRWAQRKDEILDLEEASKVSWTPPTVSRLPYVINRHQMPQKQQIFQDSTLPCSFVPRGITRKLILNFDNLWWKDDLSGDIGLRHRVSSRRVISSMTGHEIWSSQGYATIRYKNVGKRMQTPSPQEMFVTALGILTIKTLSHASCCGLKNFRWS